MLEKPMMLELFGDVVGIVEERTHPNADGGHDHVDGTLKVIYEFPRA